MWTADPARPEARAVAARGDRIVAVGSDDDVAPLVGPRTRVVEIGARLVVPGFIDAHTHFGNAAAWMFRVGLYDAPDEQAALALVAEHARRVPEGMWITGGDLGAAAAWDADAAGRPRPAPLAIDRRALDEAAPRHPVLLRRIDGAHVASSLALSRARFGPDMPDPRGGRVERDASGAPTGVLCGRAGERVVELIPPPTLEQRVIGARAALADLRAAGITSIQDVARVDALSQRRVFHTDVERSATEIELFQELQRRGELSVRVYAHLSLPLWREAVAAGITPRADDGRIRIGGMKGYIDGFFMDDPYAGRRDRGDFTFRFTDEATMAADIRGADAAGFDAVVHTIGDRAHGLLLDWYDAAIAANAPRDRRFRVIHAWYPTAAHVATIGRLGLLVDVTPQHVASDARAVEAKLGPERARTAHAWRSLADAGAKVEIVSDWPGSFNEQRATPLAPLENIALAVTREWHPEQRLTVEQALVAYTRTPAYASYEEDRKGTLADGTLADIAVVSDDVLRARGRIAGARVDLTVLDGQVIFERA